MKKRLEICLTILVHEKKMQEMKYKKEKLNLKNGEKKRKEKTEMKESRERCTEDGLVWLVGFYGIPTFVGYLTPNPFLCK